LLTHDVSHESAAGFSLTDLGSESQCQRHWLPDLPALDHGACNSFKVLPAGVWRRTRRVTGSSQRLLGPAGRAS